jgi:hypothetical protein
VTACNTSTDKGNKAVFGANTGQFTNSAVECRINYSHLELHGEGCDGTHVSESSRDQPSWSRAIILISFAAQPDIDLSMKNEYVMGSISVCVVVD